MSRTNPKSTMLFASFALTSLHETLNELVHIVLPVGLAQSVIQVKNCLLVLRIDLQSRLVS